VRGDLATRHWATSHAQRSKHFALRFAQVSSAKVGERLQTRRLHLWSHRMFLQ
jgi:hypothetical protein